MIANGLAKVHNTKQVNSATLLSMKQEQKSRSKYVIFLVNTRQALIIFENPNLCTGTALAC